MLLSSDMNKGEMTDTDADLEVGILDVSEDDPTEVAVYEVGYHFLPTLSEEEVSKEVEKITQALKGQNANFVGERFPSKISLAYSLTKKLNEKNVHFDSAYFGWIAFEIPVQSLDTVRATFHNNPGILRYLIVKTNREAVAAAMTGVIVTPTGDIGKPKRELEAGGEVSEKALEEALQTIEEEDTKTSE